jgi:hypothetical protein
LSRTRWYQAAFAVYDPADPRTVVTGVERKPSAVEIGLEPCAKIHWRRIDGDTDVAEVARAITRRNDKIKIDRCFVNDLAGAEGSSPIVQAVINIAKARNMTTTAEGVETEQQREMLLSLGCTEMQGYLFSPARPVAEIRKLLAREKRIAAA